MYERLDPDDDIDSTVETNEQDGASTSLKPYLLQDLISYEESVFTKQYWHAIINRSEADEASLAEFAGSFFKSENPWLSEHQNSHKSGTVLIDTLGDMFGSSDILIPFMKARLYDYNHGGGVVSLTNYERTFSAVHDFSVGYSKESSFWSKYLDFGNSMDEKPSDFLKEFRRQTSPARRRSILRKLLFNISDDINEEKSSSKVYANAYKNPEAAVEHLLFLDMSLQDAEKSKLLTEKILAAGYDFSKFENVRLLCELSVAIYHNKLPNSELAHEAAWALFSYGRSRWPAHECLNDANYEILTGKKAQPILARDQFLIVISSFFNSLGIDLPRFNILNTEQGGEQGGNVDTTMITQAVSSMPTLGLPLRSATVRSERELGRLFY